MPPWTHSHQHLPYLPPHPHTTPWCAPASNSWCLVSCLGMDLILVMLVSLLLLLPCSWPCAPLLWWIQSCWSLQHTGIEFPYTWCSYSHIQCLTCHTLLGFFHPCGHGLDSFLLYTVSLGIGYIWPTLGKGTNSITFHHLCFCPIWLSCLVFQGLEGLWVCYLPLHCGTQYLSSSQQFNSDLLEENEEKD